MHPEAGIFISYSPNDYYIAQTLSELLNKAGYSVFGEGRVCLIVLTPEACADPRVRDEIAAANGTIIPLLFRNCEIPDELADLPFIDFRGDVQPARQALMQRVAAVLGEPQRKRQEDGIPDNIKRMLFGQFVETGLLYRLALQRSKKDIQMLIDAQNEGILPFPEPITPTSRSREADLVWTAETEMGVSAVLSNAREYLELAEYRPVGEVDKQKRGLPGALCYTRGSHVRALVVNSPKQVRTEVEITTKSVPGIQKTDVVIHYSLWIPPLWTVTVPERLFWIAEIRELGQAVTGVALKRDVSRKRTRKIFRAQVTSCCGCYGLLIGLMVLVWLSIIVPPQTDTSNWGSVVPAAVVLMAGLFIVHLAAAWRWSR
ncbi:MAG TPA: toll/interleukin-1 receptor domain-containing protein [Aggregatilineaceae bacterium]|nr:toll/interleukin-1 receptor domain-containing protein [Aggregatilineaceae bacterium]